MFKSPKAANEAQFHKFFKPTYSGTEAVTKLKEEQEKHKGLVTEEQKKLLDTFTPQDRGLYDEAGDEEVPDLVEGDAIEAAAKKAAAKVQIKAEESLDAFATEMVYHDGDFEEMKLCLKSYQSKMVWLGPNKTPVMLKRYLQLYSKKKTVSPQSIR